MGAVSGFPLAGRVDLGSGRQCFLLGLCLLAGNVSAVEFVLQENSEDRLKNGQFGAVWRV